MVPWKFLPQGLCNLWQTCPHHCQSYAPSGLRMLPTVCLMKGTTDTILLPHANVWVIWGYLMHCKPTNSCRGTTFCLTEWLLSMLRQALIGTDWDYLVLQQTDFAYLWIYQNR